LTIWLGGHGLGVHRLLNEPVELLASVLRASPVKPEGELVQVVTNTCFFLEGKRYG